MTKRELQARYDALLAAQVDAQNAVRAAHAEEKKNPETYNRARMEALGEVAKRAQRAFGEFVQDNPQLAPKGSGRTNRAGKRQAAERRALDAERQRAARIRGYYR